MMSVGTPRGAALEWLAKHTDYAGESCLIWPFCRHFKSGRAHGKMQPVRWMCEAAHGPPPSKHHHAAHNCGMAHIGCVNPTHLRWATPAENNSDKTLHGTQPQGSGCYNARLTEDEVREIRSRAMSCEQKALAPEYGVTVSMISRIVLRKAWKHIT